MPKGNPHPKQNYKFPKAPQGLNEKKSMGQIRARAALNVMATLQTELSERNMIPKICDVVEQEIENGHVKNGLKLIEIAKEHDINVNSETKITQVSVSRREQKKIIQHINEVINDE